MNDTNTSFPTLSPSQKPTYYPTDADIITTQAPTNSDAPTGNPTPMPTEHDVEIIKFPSYESKDPVDGIFIVIAIILLVVALVACFQNVRNNRIRAMNQ